MADLKTLYAAAGGGAEFTYTRLVQLAEQHGCTVAKSNLSDWFNKTPPQRPRHVDYVTQVLIPFLEDRAARRTPGHVRMPVGAWGRRLRAAQGVSTGGQGGHGPRVHAASRGRLLKGPSQALLDVLPGDLEDREQEVAELRAFVTAPAGAPSYMWWQAGPWAGKTALVSWFAARQLPAGVDVAHYVVAGRLGTDRRDGFVLAVGEQLAAAAGSRRRPALDRKRPALDLLYEAAARARAERHRRLVLLVDGLDEDADAGLESAGIAGLLPKVPPYGMRVIVTGRPHPRVPVKLAPDHPLRDASIVRRLSHSPAARIIRDTATVELRTLLADRDIGRRLLGLLVSARGALTGADLSDLLPGTTPYDIQEKLGTVAGRSMAPTRTGRLPLNVRTEADAEAGRQTFVLAHATLYETARTSLGSRFLAERTDDLHRWARHYQDAGWPEDTPDYVLTGYPRLLHEAENIGRLTALVLDPRRQLRLVRRSGADVALAQLDLVAPPGTDGSPPPSLATAAAVAASRELLSAHVRPLPDSVVRTVARLGDAQRARALAGTCGRAVDKALNLAGVAHVLKAMGDEQAADAAREAGRWARAALRETYRLGYAADEAEIAAAQAALALLETMPEPDPRGGTASAGQVVDAGARPDAGFPAPPGNGRGLPGQYEDALALLRSTRGTNTARDEAWAPAARLLAPDHPECAAELLDELEEQAETLAGADPAEGVAAAGAIQLWQLVASVAPHRADRLHDRVLAYATEVWEAAPTLENVSAIAAAASLLARYRPVQAGTLVDAACRYLDHVLSVDAGPLSAADAFHAEFGFRHTLTVFSQALADVGAVPETSARVLELGQRVLPPEPVEQPGPPDLDENEDQAFAEATKLAGQAFRLADRGAVGEAEHSLEQALALLPTAAPGSGHAPVWLPDLAGALVRTRAAAQLAPLPDLVRHPADQVRLHAALALAHADSLQAAAALHHARTAARAAASAAAATSWPYAAHALACAGEVESALSLIARHTRPDGAGGRAAWRKADRAVRIAVATELATVAPEAAAELVLPLLKRLDAARHTIRSQGLLSSLAELLPATTHLPPEQRLIFDTAWEYAREQPARSSPHSRHPEDVLVQAFLCVGAGDHPGRQLDWLTKDLANRGSGHFPTAALAVLHVALGDPTTALRVATLPGAPHCGAAALTAVASHVARIPHRPCPVSDPTGTDPFTLAIRHLALKTTSAAPAARETAIKPLHRALATSGWYQAIPVLSQLAPEAVVAVWDIAVVHLRAPQTPHTECNIDKCPPCPHR
ncbi:hypothetical protein [Streptomyces sp. NPDC005435]|uniref:hypothetical protein n=1 Tax=Streptomyces sp. NPDC005435 TaxID=3154464 RepID=UPI0034536EA0